jgi:FtsZ-binding cell division protein ZapB
MNKYHPGQKPPFLFDETERNTHTAINADTFRALQADRDAAKAEIEKLKALLVNAHEERDRLHGENKSLQAKTDKFLTQTERNSLLVIIAALCDYSAIMYEERGAAQRIMKMTDEIGAHLDDQTIRTALEKIPNAVESRGEIGMK